jgi:Asp-tRNA(Asn)/Glu-tRNA(Gln) amidotransferase A subunit family amidase
MANAPICLQLVGPQWQDEMVLEAAKQLTSLLE